MFKKFIIGTMLAFPMYASAQLGNFSEEQVSVVCSTASLFTFGSLIAEGYVAVTGAQSEKYPDHQAYVLIKPETRDYIYLLKNDNELCIFDIGNNIQPLNR